MSSAPAETDGQPRQDKSLQAYARVILRYRRMVAAVFLSILALAALRSFTKRPLYRAEALILIERENPSVLTFKGVADVNERGWADDYYQTQYKLLQSRALAQKVIEDLDLLRDADFGVPREEGSEAARAAGLDPSAAMQDAIGAFLDRLSVQWIRNSRLMSVSFEASRAELAARVANRLAEIYIQQALESRYETSAEATRWLGGQIDEQRGKVEAAEVALQGIREKEGIVNIEERRALVAQRLKELGSALTGLKSQRLQKDALFRQMQAVRDPEELPEALRSHIIESLRVDLAKLDRQLVELRERYLEQHPEVLRVRNQIEQTRRTIAEESVRIVRAAENDYKAAAAQEASVATALEAAKAEAVDLERRAIQYDSLKRELEAGKEVLNGLMSRRKQAGVAQELKSSNVRIADAATAPRFPFRPRRLLDLLVGLLLGGSLSVALALLRDHLDETLTTPDDVRLGLGVPLLAVIPLRARPGNGKETLPAPGAEEGPFREGYRLLRTALRHAWGDQRPRVVMVTSTAPGEGKTLTSVNLAQALAAAGERTLLIDADLRKPQVHEVVGARRTPGIVDLLAGDVGLQIAIQELPAGLGFLGSGGPRPGPADLLTVEGFTRVLDGARGLYRWIVVDTSPVGAVADALVMAPSTDGVVVVAAAETVPRTAVRRTLERVAESGARVLGVVLNRARVDRRGYDYQHHYGHGYGAYHEAPAPPDVAPLKQRVAP